MVDGTALGGPQDLRAALLARSDVFVATLTERLMTYALGRELEPRHAGRPRRRACRRGGELHLRSLLQAIVASDSFQKRVKTGDAPVPREVD